MKPRLFTPEISESHSRPTAFRGAHAALALFAAAGLIVTVAAPLVADELFSEATLAPQSALAHFAGLLYLLLAAIVHAKIFFDLGRTLKFGRLQARLLLVSHGMVALAVLYSFAIQRLTSRALLVGLDPLLSSTAILSLLACVVALAMATQRQFQSRHEGEHPLLPERLFFGASLLFAGGIVWLELSPLPT
jgi:hypothetical protein